MFYKFYQHSGYYIFLATILIFGLLVTYLTHSNRIFQVGTIIATTSFYVLWGIMHHLINHDLSLKIVIEYILIGAFGLTVIFFLLRVL